MADEVKLDIKITVPTSVEVSGDMPIKWASGLTTNAERINDRRIAKIPDEGVFQAKVAVPSTNKFSPMIDSAFVSRSGRNQANIIRAQYKNLADSFDDYDSKLALAFATVDGVVAKRFVDQVNNSKDRWATAVEKKTLRATGDKIRGTILGQATYWMAGDYRAHQMTNHLEIVAGAPYDFTHAGLKAAFKAAFMAKAVQGLMMILNADMLAAELIAQNAELTAVCNHLRDATVAPVKPFQPLATAGATDSLALFKYSDPELLLHCRIVLV